MVFMGMGQASRVNLSQEQVGGKEKEAVRFGKGGQGHNFPLDQGDSGHD